MAFIQMNMMSQCLMRTVQVNVILPADKIEMPDKVGQKVRGNDGPFKTLYLLHGVFGSQVDWVNGTNIQRWAEEKNLAVVMPAGENMFYLDQPQIHNFYGRFIGEELVELTRRMFPLSHKREDTFIGGLSMGGYGALRNGLVYHDTFGYIASLSGANVFERQTSDMFYGSKEHLEALYGSLEEARNSDKNIKWLIRQCAKEGKTDQKIYLACGIEDFLLEGNRSWKQQFNDAGFDLTYEEGSGAHEWDFWNRYIKHVVDWLPLDEANQGINSGNVR